MSEAFHFKKNIAEPLTSLIGTGGTIWCKNEAKISCNSPFKQKSATYS